MVKCQECNKRKARVKFSDEPIFTLTHGFGGVDLCRQCYIKRIEKELIGIRKNLKKQKELLKKGK